MTLLDHILFAVVCLASPLIDWLWLYPRFQRALAAGVAGARQRGYIITMLTSWGLTACVIALWLGFGRPLEYLRLGGGNLPRTAIGLALTAIYIAFALAQRRVILRQPDAAEIVRRQLGRADALMPHTPRELTLFRMVAITAGICEEVLYRGFVMWYLAIWISLVPAAIVSSILFGLAHTYIGVPHVIRTMIVGGVFAALALGTGSLWPGVILHAAVDLFSGDLGYHVLHRQHAQAET
jgi:membrane protease YdiL (CAAX protease family)